MMKNLWLAVLLTRSLLANDLQVDRYLPDEYEAVPGAGTALANSGVASPHGVASIRTNPALVGVERTYAVTGGYIWPTTGRDFYNAGVIDSQSSKVGAAFNYQGFTDDYRVDLLEKDSPVVSRMHLALAQNVGSLALGIGGQYLEAQSLVDTAEVQKIKGTAINFGAAGMLSPKLRMGLSVENMGNRKIADYAPKTYRVGFALLLSGDLQLQLDLRQRDRIVAMEQSTGSSDLLGLKLSAEQKQQLDSEDAKFESPERMAIASFEGRVYDMIKILGAYGRNVDGPERQSLAGGISITSGNAALTYSAARPYMSSSVAQQSIHASVSIKL